MSAPAARLLTLIRSTPHPDPAFGELGAVADAAVFPDGVSVLHWRASGVTEVYPSEEKLREVRERTGRSVFHESPDEEDDG